MTDKICTTCLQPWPDCLCVRGVVLGGSGQRPPVPRIQVRVGPYRPASGIGDTKEICTVCYQLISDCRCPRKGI